MSDKPISMKGQGNILKVVRMGLNDRVYQEMKKDTFSVEKLTKELNAEGKNITAQSIRKFIRKTKKAQQELISKDLRSAEQFKNLTMDYSRELKDILEEVKTVKNQAITNKDLATYNQLVGRIFQGIELIAKITGDIKPKGNVDIKIIYNEISNKIEKDMDDIKKDIFSDSPEIIDAEIIKDDKNFEQKIQGETKDE